MFNQFKDHLSIRSLLILSVVFQSILSHAIEVDSFSNVFLKYNTSALVSMDITKKVKSELLGTEKTQNGKMYFSKEKFRITFFEPKKEMVVYDGKTLWTEQAIGSDAKEKFQIGRLQITTKNKSQILISALFDNKFFAKNFQRTSTAKRGAILIYTYKALSPDLNISNLSIEVNESEKSIVKISYEDDLNNLTELLFSNVLFMIEKQPSLFKYTPPKNAEVTNL